jgi:hypothetical protein
VVGRYHDTVVESECWISGARSWSKVYGGGLRKTKRDAMHCPFEPLTQPIAPLKHTESIHSFFRATTQWNQDPSPQPPLLETTNLVESRPAAAASAAQNDELGGIETRRRSLRCSNGKNVGSFKPIATASAATGDKPLGIKTRRRSLRCSKRRTCW